MSSRLRETKRAAPLNVAGAEDSSTEISETAIAESDAFEHFDLVVDPFGEAVGVGAVESVENVGLPVFQHRQAGGILWQIGNERMCAKGAKAFLRLQGAGRIHEVVEYFFEQIRFSQIA